MEVLNPASKLLNCSYKIEPANGIDKSPIAHVVLTVQRRLTKDGELPPVEKIHVQLPGPELQAFLVQMAGVAASLNEAMTAVHT